MKILLINPFTKFTELKRHGGDTLPPLGLGYIAAVLLKDGHEVKIYDGEGPSAHEEEFIEVFSKFDPDIVGIAVYTPKYENVIHTIEAIKNIRKDVKFIGGGPHFSIQSVEQLKEITDFDYIVVGEGEETLPELIDAIENNASLNNIKGIGYKNNGSFVINEPRPYIDDLDKLPFPALELLDDLPQRKSTFRYKQLPMMVLISSRGCPYKCTFCNTAFGKKFRARSAKNVVDEIEYWIKKYGFKELMLLDDIFIMNVKRVKEICELLIERKINITWSCTGRVDIFYNHPELMPIMKKAGCWYLSFGIETADENQQKVLKKNLKMNEVKKVVWDAYKHGFFIHSGFMIGIPGDTKESIRKTIDLAKSLPINGVQFAITMPYPGTELYDIAAQHGKFEKDGDFRRMSTHSPDPVFVTKGLSKEYLSTMQKKAYREFYLRPSYLLRQIPYITSLDTLRKFMFAFYSHVKTYILKGY